MRAVKLPDWAAVPAAGLILFARMPDRLLHPQFFAEDAYFYEGALRAGAKSLVQPYGGYLLSVQRLAAWAATGLPPLRVPLFFNLVAFGLTLAVLARILSPRVALSHRWLLVLAVVLIPHVEDLFLVLENIMWVLALGLIALLVSSDARRPLERWGDGAMALVFGLTGVFSVLLLPLFLWRAWRRRTRASGILAGLVGAAALVQAWAILHSPPYKIEPPDPFDPARVPAIVGFHLFARNFGAGGLSGLSFFSLSLAGGLWCLLLLRLCLISDRPAPEREARRALLVIIGLTIAASIYRFKDELGMFLSPEPLERYFFIPEVLGLWLLVAELSSRPARRWLALVLGGAYLATSLGSWRVEPMVDLHWAEYAPRLSGPEHLDVPINPPGWIFRYPGR